MKERICCLLKEMNKDIYEKETEMALALLAALAGESIILLGPPGVAKSMIARRLKLAFKDAKSFEYLMSRFSTPDEIFGPVSIQRLKSSDCYERNINGYLPTADVVFLDEIWKAGPAIQNTLLTVINEKLFRNGNNEIHIPLKLIIAASNELPTQGEGLEALWDRFIIRLESHGIQKDENFNKMLLDTNNNETPTEDNDIKKLQISNDEYNSWGNIISNISISSEVLDCITMIRRSIRNVRVDDADERRNVYVSDRRWKNIVRILRTSAYLQDRKEVSLLDIMPIYHCLWQEPDERDAIRDIVVRCIFAFLAKEFADMKETLEEDIKTSRYKKAKGLVTRRQQQRDSNKKTYNNFYYRLPLHDTGNTFVVMTDYQQLPEIGNEPSDAVLYNDKRNPKATIIRAFDADGRMPIGSRPVTLARDNDNIYIDGVRFDVEKTQKDNSEELISSKDDDTETIRDYSKEIDLLADNLRELQKNIENNIFVSEEDKECIRQYLKDFFKEIAFTRQDTMKLYE